MIEKQAHLIGNCSLGLSNHSPACKLEMGCSLVAIKYLSSSSGPPSTTLYSSSSNCSSCAVLAMYSFRMKNGVWIFLYPLVRRKSSPYEMSA